MRVTQYKIEGLGHLSTLIADESAGAAAVVDPRRDVDVYLEAARGLGVAPERCAAVEDSRNGIRSARAAGMRVVAIPNPRYPPGDDALADADLVLRSLDELTPERLSAS